MSNLSEKNIDKKSFLHTEWFEHNKTSLTENVLCLRNVFVCILS